MQHSSGVQVGGQWPRFLVGRTLYCLALSRRLARNAAVSAPAEQHGPRSCPPPHWPPYARARRRRSRSRHARRRLDLLDLRLWSSYGPSSCVLMETAVSENLRPCDDRRALDVPAGSCCVPLVRKIHHNVGYIFSRDGLRRAARTAQATITVHPPQRWTRLRWEIE